MLNVTRPYQHRLMSDVHDAWNNGAQNVIPRLDTGGGKTHILARIHTDHQGYSIVIAHRHELVGQISKALAREGVYHKIIAADKTIKGIMQDHIIDFGRSYYEANARVHVASVDTLVRSPDLQKLSKQITLWTVDEAHHLVLDNKWHTAIAGFTNKNVKGLMPTATPVRADGKGLGRPPHGDGVADVMVEGPPMRWLIEQGYLCDYDVACPPSDLEMIGDPGASGDWSTKQLRDAVRRSHIVGDVVSTYMSLAPGRLGITFSTDTETAREIADQYNAAGVRAETLFGTTDPGVRRTLLRRYANREILQLVVVDIVSEGFDLPAMEVASSIRKTESLSLYMQQFGRVLRPLPGKGRALYIDHVGNIVRHQGTPDKPRVWSLSRRDRKSRGNAGIPLRTCLECWKPYERFKVKCPHCGAEPPPPAARGTPEIVEGDLHILSPEALARLRGLVARAELDPVDYGRALYAQHVPAIGVSAGVNRQRENLAARVALKDSMARWGGIWHKQGLDDREIQKLFWFTFNIDVLTAQTLNAHDSTELDNKIRATL